MVEYHTEKCVGCENLPKNVTVSISDDLAEKMDEMKDINWSEVCRRAIAKYIEAEKLRLGEEIKNKMEEFWRRLEESKETPEKFLQDWHELRAYLKNLVDSEPVPMWKNIGMMYVSFLDIAKIILNLATTLSGGLSQLDKRVKRIEDELRFREK